MVMVNRPYSGPDDKDLPENVKKLPENKKAQWVAVFNSAFERCMKDNGNKDECEQSAFAQAWGVVNKEKKSSILNRLFDKFLDNLKKDKGSDETRALGLSDIYWAVADLVGQEDEYAWVMDIYHDGEEVFAIVAKDSKLYRIGLTVEGSMVKLNENWEQVTLEFIPSSETSEEVKEQAKSHTRTTLRQMSDGRWRWFSISSTSVLNRVGEIDSRQLFDNFIKHIEEGEDYPLRMFYHAGEVFRVGKVDFVGRDGYCLITSGLYDDSELARREIQARLKAPDEWGQSIGFMPKGSPELIKARMNDGTEVTIPVYTDGIFVEESTLPESQAAAWMTATPTVKEVNRMLSKAQKEAFIKLFDGDEEAAEEWLRQNVENRNRVIIEEGMIARNLSADEAVVREEETEEEERELEIELNDTLIDEIATRVGSALAPTLKRVDDVQTQVEALAQTLAALQETVTQLVARVEALEASEEERRQIWLEDLPARRRLRVTYRPRQGDVTPPVSQNEETAEDNVMEILERIPIKY